MTDSDLYKRLPPEDRERLELFKRQMQEAKSRGEDTTPILRKFILTSIDDLLQHERAKLQAELDARPE